jgi:hypothetical protein
MGQKVYSTDSVDTINVDSTGNVGIGTASPAKKLHVSGGDVRLGDNEINALGGIELGLHGTGDRNTFIDFHSSGTPGSLDFSGRVIRGAGVNGNLEIRNTGTGVIDFIVSNGIKINSSGAGTSFMGVATFVTTLPAAGSGTVTLSIPAGANILCAFNGDVSANGAVFVGVSGANVLHYTSGGASACRINVVYYK